MIHCINCGHVNAEGTSHCEACFEPLPAVTSCPTCQAIVPDDAYFCPQCGASLPRGVSNQPNSPGENAEESPQSLSDVPPTNVVAQQSFNNPPLPPTNVVHPPSPSEIPPTNVVHPPTPSDLPPTYIANAPVASEIPPTNVVNPLVPDDVPPPSAPVVPSDSPRSDIPPTNVVNPLPDTLPPQSPPGFPSDIPPTNVVHPLPDTLPPQQPPGVQSDLPPTDVVNPLPPDAPVVDAPPVSPPAESDEPPSQIETVPTMVVSPGSDRDVVDTPLPPSDPTVPPFVPPTVPPQATPTYQYPDPEADTESSSTNMPFPGDLPKAPQENTLSAPMTEAMVDEAPPQFEDSVPSATTVQTFNSPVGETVIQKPAARLLHERTNTNIALPTNLEIILIGKLTSSITPDVDVSGFMDSDVVSRRHAALFMTPEGYFIEDLGSSNGTYVNDVPCTHGDRMPINPGDRICLGRENKVAFIFQVG